MSAAAGQASGDSEGKGWISQVGQLRSKHAEGVTVVITDLLSPFQDKCDTITFDNGKEFAEHGKVAAALKVDIRRVEHSRVPVDAVLV